MNKKTLIFLIGLLPALLAWPLAQAQAWTASASLSSDYRVRGVSLGNRHAALAADLGYQLDTGWSFGLGAAALGRDSQGERTLLTASASRAWQLDGDWSADLGIAHLAYPGPHARRAYDYDELRSSLHWRGLWTGSLSYSPSMMRSDGYGHFYKGRAASAETSLRLPLGQGWAVDAGLGVYHLEAEGSASYVYGNLGLAWATGPWQAQLDYIGSNARKKGLASSYNAAGAWVGSLIWSF